MGPRKCLVCNEIQSKYKCPTCLIPYCSLGCFKKHKGSEIPCVNHTSSGAELNKNSDFDAAEASGVTSVSSLENTSLESIVQRPLYIQEPSEVLQQLQLESIASSSELRLALKDEGLQKLIRNIDSSQDAESELEKAMGSEVFRIFTDKILYAINPETDRS